MWFFLSAMSLIFHTFGNSAITRNFWQADALNINVPTDESRFISRTSKQASKLTRVKQVRYHYAVGKKPLNCCVVTIVVVQSSAFDRSNRNEPKTHCLRLAKAEVQVSSRFSGMLQRTRNFLHASGHAGWLIGSSEM